MRFIVDTQAWLWWHTEPEKLKLDARKLMEDSKNELVLSVASVWEISIKYATGKLPLPEHPKSYVLARVGEVTILDIKVSHALECSDLPPHHKDPFDRIIIAQAKIENIPVLTADSQFKQYRIKILEAA